MTKDTDSLVVIVSHELGLNKSEERQLNELYFALTRWCYLEWSLNNNLIAKKDKDKTELELSVVKIRYLRLIRKATPKIAEAIEMCAEILKNRIS